MNFHETQMGQMFFSQQLPRLIEALQSIAKAQSQLKSVFYRSRQAGDDDDILSDLFFGNYEPECMKRRENDPDNEKIHQTMKPLLDSFSQEQLKLFLQYEAAAHTRSSNVSCRAYRDGVQLAVQMILAGCASSAQATGKEEDLQ